jgi:hypothetical protein
MTDVVQALDMFGRSLKPGDVIAYALTIDRSAKMGVYRVDELVPTECGGPYRMPGAPRDWRVGAHVQVKVKATQLAVSYGHLNKKPVTLAMTNDRAVLLIEKGPWQK